MLPVVLLCSLSLEGSQGCMEVSVVDCYRQEGILAGCFDSVPSVGMLGRLDSWNFYWFVPVYESQMIPGSLQILAMDLGTMSGTPTFTPGRPHSV